MKYVIVFFLIAFSCCVRAQSSKALEVGDKAPVFNPMRWIKGEQVHAYQPGKIYVIEFGATWCTPCAQAIPYLSAIADKFKDDVVVISTFVMETRQSGDTSYLEKVDKYVAKKDEAIRYSVAVDGPDQTVEREWLQPAGKTGIPQFFVIDKNGSIAWIMSDFKAVADIVEKVNSQSYDIEQMTTDAKKHRETEYDPSKLLLVDGNGGRDDEFLFRSVLTRYDGKIKADIPPFIDSENWRASGPEYKAYVDRTQIIGASISELYYLAYGDTLSNMVHFRNWKNEWPDTVELPRLKTTYGKLWYEPILEVTDDIPFQWSLKSTLNRYNYSLKVPDGVGTAGLKQAILRRDLESYFGFSVSVETRVMHYWRVSAPDKKYAISKLASKDQSKPFVGVTHEQPFLMYNADMRDIILLLGANFGYGWLDYGKLPKPEQSAFIDETGIEAKIDFVFDERMTFEEIRQHLKGYGLEVTKAYKPFRVVVIRDPVEDAE